MKPVANCKDTILYLPLNGLLTIDSSFIDNGSYGFCSDINRVIISQSIFDCNNVGNNLVTLTVIDAKGDSSFCMSNVNIIDTITPLFTCLPDSTMDLGNSCEYIVPNFMDMLTYTDNCDSSYLTLTQTPLPGTLIDLSTQQNNLFTQTIILSGIDQSSNIINCMFDLQLNCSVGIIIPQFISPNEDGKNDKWEIENISNYPNNDVKVFNRWGTLVYKTDNYNNDWKGEVNSGISLNNSSSKESKLPSGVYFYIVDLGNEEKPYTGYIQIMR